MKDNTYEIYRNEEITEVQGEDFYDNYVDKSRNN
jgi:hypothetical protein